MFLREVKSTIYAQLLTINTHTHTDIRKKNRDTQRF